MQKLSRSFSFWRNGHAFPVLKPDADRLREVRLEIFAGPGGKVRVADHRDQFVVEHAAPDVQVRGPADDRVVRDR